MTAKKKTTPPAKTKTTALATRRPRTKKATALMPAPATEVVVRTEGPAQPAPIPWHERPLESGVVSLGQFAMQDVKFTNEEEAVLGRPFDLGDLRVKPTGAVYVPHAVYTRRLIEAFGRTGWALRPLQTPVMGNGTVVIKFMLFVHGTPVAVADGEQEYFDGNKDQSYGDAIEACHSSALRRVCKHLGIGLELWDKAFADQFLEEFCVEVFNEKTSKYQWRRVVDKPFWWEKKNKSQAARREHIEPQAPQHAPVAHAAMHDHANEVITEAQQRRLWAIIRKAHRDEVEVKDWLRERFQIDSTRKIRRRDYDTVCQVVESTGSLLFRREPGQEG